MMVERIINRDMICYFFLVTILGLYSWLISIHTMPIPDGWYIYYGKCMEQGNLPYRDFEYLFTPLYIYIMGGIYGVFSTTIIYYKFLGVVIYCLIGTVVFKILKLLFTRLGAFIGTIVSVLYLQTEVAQVFYDYVRVMDLFALLSTYSILLIIKGYNDKKNPLKYYIAAGVYIALFTLIKQNMGLIFLAYSIVALLIVNKYYKNTIQNVWKCILAFMLSYLMPILLGIFMLSISGSYDAFIEGSTKDALAAKGGWSAVLFGWIFRLPPILYDQWQVVLAILLMFCVIYFYKDVIEKYKDKSNIDILWFFSVVMIGFFILEKHGGLAHRFEWSIYISPYYIFFIVFPIFVWMCVSVLYDIKNNNKTYKNISLLALIGAYEAISYGCGTSGGLAEGQATLGMGFLCASTIDCLYMKRVLLVRCMLIAMFSLLTLQLMDRKMVHTYYWWESNESNYWLAKSYSDIPAMKGVMLSEETKKLYEGVYHDIINNSTANDKILCFPRNPIFYVISNRMDPGIYAKVQWFDVSSEKTLKSDWKIIEENNPKLIVYMKTPENVIEAHELAFRNNSVSETRIMNDNIIKLTKEKYTVLGKYIANNNELVVYKRRD